MPSAASRTSGGTDRNPSTLLRTRMSSVYVVSGMIAVSSESPKIGRRKREGRDARDRVEDAADGRDRAVDARLADRPDREEERDDEAERDRDERQLEVLGRPRRDVVEVRKIQSQSMSGLPSMDGRSAGRGGSRRRRSAAASSSRLAVDAERLAVLALAHHLDDPLDGHDPLHGARPVDDDRRLDVGVEHHRERVLERRALVDRAARPGWRSDASRTPRRSGWRRRRSSRSGWRRRRPAAGSRTARRAPAPGRGRVVTDRADGRLDQLEVADPVERQALEARGPRRRTGRRTPTRGWPGSRPASRTGRPRPPSWKTATRSPILIASSMSWVTNRIVLASSSWRRRNSFWRRSRTIGSTAPNGSSMSMIGGSTARARATPTRWRSPPDSWLGKRSRYFAGSRPTRARSSSARAPLALLRPAQQARHRGHVLADRLVREEADLLDDVADAPAELGHVARRRRRRRR